MFIRLREEKEPVSAIQTEWSLVFSNYTELFYLLLFCTLWTIEENYNIFLCLRKLQIYIVTLLSSVPGKGQALSLEDTDSKKWQVSVAIQPNTLDKWRYTDRSYLAIRHIFPWKMELTPLSQKMFFGFMRSTNMPKKLSKKVCQLWWV